MLEGLKNVTFIRKFLIDDSSDSNLILGSFIITIYTNKFVCNLSYQCLRDTGTYSVPSGFCWVKQRNKKPTPNLI